MNTQEALTRNTRKIRWGIVGMLVAAGVFLALATGDFGGYLMSWCGTMFKALSGGLMGWLVSRYVVGLDLSSTTDEQRPLAGLSQAFLIGAFALALATGA
jgi:hypothetical protein